MHAALPVHALCTQVTRPDQFGRPITMTVNDGHWLFGGLWVEGSPKGPLAGEEIPNHRKVRG